MSKLDFIKGFKEHIYLKDEDKDNFKKNLYYLKYSNGSLYYDDTGNVIYTDSVSELNVDSFYMDLNEYVNNIYFLDDRRSTLKIEQKYDSTVNVLDYEIDEYNSYYFPYNIIEGETIVFSMPPYAKTVNGKSYYCSGWSWSEKL